MYEGFRKYYKVTRFLSEKFGKPLTPAELSYLFHIMETPGITREELSKVVGVTSGALSMMKNLFTRTYTKKQTNADGGICIIKTTRGGVIEEYPDPIQPKRALVRLTKEGVEMMKVIDKIFYPDA